MTHLSTGLIVTLVVVFATSGASKLRGPDAQRTFAASLGDLPFLPARSVRGVAAALTAGELMVAADLLASLIAGWAGLPGAVAMTAVALTATAILLITLTVGIAITLRRGVRAGCACFGSAHRPLGVSHLVRNVLLLAAAGTAAALPPAPPVRPQDLLVAVTAGAVAAFLIIHADDMAELFAANPGQ